MRWRQQQTRGERGGAAAGRPAGPHQAHPAPLCQHPTAPLLPSSARWPGSAAALRLGRAAARAAEAPSGPLAGPPALGCAASRCSRRQPGGAVSGVAAGNPAGRWNASWRLAAASRDCAVGGAAPAAPPPRPASPCRRLRQHEALSKQQRWQWQAGFMQQLCELEQRKLFFVGSWHQSRRQPRQRKRC